MTKAYKVEHFDRTARDRDSFMLATNDILNGAVLWSSWVREGDSQGKYRVGMSRLDSPAGGLLIVTFRHPGQSDYTTVQQLDDMESIGYIHPALTEAIWQARNAWHKAHEVAA